MRQCVFVHNTGIHKQLQQYFLVPPPTRWSLPVIELSRLVRKEDTNPKPILTKLISKGVKECKRLGYDLIVSFADSTFDHHGGIYQAASWNFFCMRKPQNDGWIIDGEFVPRRTCYARYGTSGNKIIDILAKQNKTCIKHFDSGKYLYWKALNKSGEEKAKLLKLDSNTYLKPDKEE